MPQATARNNTVSMLDAIAPDRVRFSVVNSAAPVLTACPFCKVQPEIKTGFFNRAVIFCDCDDCGERPQAMGDTVALAAATWNQRIIDGELV